MSKFSAIIEGLTQQQLPAFFGNLARQLNIPLNTSRLKSGVVADRILAIDDAGRFIAAKGTRLKNGDIGTICNFGTCNGSFSKEVPANLNPERRGFIESLAEQLKPSGHVMNLDRTKTGLVDGHAFGYDDAGKYIFTRSVEMHKGTYGVVGTVGKFESAASKVVPKSALNSGSLSI